MIIGYSNIFVTGTDHLNSPKRPFAVFLIILGKSILFIIRDLRYWRGYVCSLYFDIEHRSLESCIYSLYGTNITSYLVIRVLGKRSQSLVIRELTAIFFVLRLSAVLSLHLNNLTGMISNTYKVVSLSLNTLNVRCCSKLDVRVRGSRRLSLLRVGPCHRMCGT